jgi:hypothetical protein
MHVDELVVNFEGSKEVCEDVLGRARAQGNDASEVMASGSALEALNAPITGAEIIVGAHVVAAAFKAAAATVVFIKETRDLLRPEQSVAASRSGRQRPLKMSSSTSDREIEEYVSHDDVEPGDDSDPVA